MLFHVLNVNSFTINFSNTSTFVNASILVEIAFSFNITISQRISLSIRRQTASTQLLMLSFRINNQSVSSSSFFTTHSQFASSTMQNSSIQFFEHLECQKTCLTRSNNSKNVNIWFKEQICTWEIEMSWSKLCVKFQITLIRCELSLIR